MTGARLLYTVLAYLLVPAALLRLVWRARGQRAYLRFVPERFGRYRTARRRPLIWVHAVSVGETRAAEPLVKALRERHPSHQFLLTHMTPTGRETGSMLFGGSVAQCYLPYDLPGAVERFLDYFEPSCGVLLETELWPNLIAACHRRGIPLTLANARMSQRSFHGYRRFGSLIAPTLRMLHAVAAQSGDDADRLAALGARHAKVTGNLKFDSTPEPESIRRGEQWRASFSPPRAVLLAASTREGEEALLIDAIAGSDAPDVLVLLVPRHPQRFRDVAQLLERAGVRYVRRSDGARVGPDVRVVLGDTMGEMYAYYAACDVAILGGSLLPMGGQNLIEACAVGRPVVVGPHMFNFAEATRLALEAGAAVQAGDARSAVTEALALMRDSARCNSMSRAGRELTLRHRGAADRVAGMMGLPEAGATSPATD